MRGWVSFSHGRPVAGSKIIVAMPGIAPDDWRYSVGQMSESEDRIDWLDEEGGHLTMYDIERSWFCPLWHYLPSM